MGSDLFRIVLLGALLPGLIVGVGLLLLWGLLRPEGREDSPAGVRRLRWGAPLLLFLGFLAIQGATGTIGPELWSSNVGDRFLALGALALAVALLDAASPWRLLGLLGAAVGGALAAWMIVVVLHPHLLNTGDVVWWSLLGGAGAPLGVFLQECLPTRRGVVEAAQGALLVGGLMGLLYWSGQAPSVPELGGLQGMLVAAGVATAIVGVGTLARGGWAFVAIVLVGYLALARALGDLTPPDGAIALVLGGVLTGALVRWLGAKTGRGGLGGIIAQTLCAAPIGVGSLLAWRAYDSIDAGFDEDDDDGVYYTDEDG
ncbi:MAG: hypothetical protein ACIARR_08615, partial [Phycisphaerales bacterium JB059]